MSKEMMWLTLTVILTGVLWIPYILDRIMVRGLMGAMANPSRDDKPQSRLGAAALVRAYQRGGKSGRVRALVLILMRMNHSTAEYRASPARSISGRGWCTSIVYTLGIPVLRTLAFAVGFVCQVTLALAVFGKL